MEVLKIFILLLVCVASGRKIVKKEDSSITIALRAKTNYFSKQNEKFLIVNYRNEKEVIESFRLENVSYELQNVKVYTHVHTVAPITYGDKSILTFDTVKLFRNINQMWVLYDTVDIHPKQQFVYCKNLTIQNLMDMIKLRDVRDEHIHYYQYFLLEMKNVMGLVTIGSFSPTSCNKPNFVVINSFNKNTNRWNNTRFEIDKFTNYHGCELKLFIRGNKGKSYDFLLYSKQIDNNSIECHRVWFEAMIALSKNFNLTLKSGNSRSF
jgi:hypothetical protein